MSRSLDDLLPTPLDARHLAALVPLSKGEDLLALLDRWVERGWLRALDRAFVSFLGEREPGGDPLVLLAAALASHQLGHGHVCLDLQATLVEPDFALSLPPEGDALAGPLLLPSQLLERLELDTWLQQLRSSRLVAQGSSEQDSARPLVLNGQRLYLRRYWAYERRVDNALRERLQQVEPTPADLSARLAQLFEGGAPSGQVDWQKLACALATRSAFSIITGGPGTGKTTTVVRLLALLQSPAVEAGRPLRIRLAAPTGKAAARLTESIGQQVERLAVAADVRENIPTDVSTVHRLLGSRPGSRHFRHHAGNPLPLDVLVVDEASMIDLEMMANLLGALPPHARLVLLGDKDQLASVEAGAVLGDLCRDAEAGRYSPQTQAWLEQVSGAPLAGSELLPGSTDEFPLAQQVVMLRFSRRFGEGSGIGQLARLVNRQEADQARALLNQKQDDVFALSLRSEQDRNFDRLLLEGLGHGSDGPQGYRSYLQTLRQQRPPLATPVDDPRWETWALQVLQGFETFQLLCAVRKGPWGVEGLNQRVSRVLGDAGLIDSEQPWYEGRPVLMTRNDYGLGLMNGDIGIALRLPDEQHPEQQVLRVAFARNDGKGGVRFVLPSRLNEVETVFAMTVHKSQGSEFTHTALVLPDTLNPVLTKELIYTGITRAKTCFSLIEPRLGVFEDAVRRKVKRISGLMLEQV
ncbi:exodeoxyribonuclease V subunit alpha [Pseudomonas rubra]|uniref:RecBCD enzyme subunit RecD n=1 Tax=Pseudomonas rubra TaxID=2942627 RepID=A0ABT5PDP3_9PSED|nr:exodeoxyribonuclease V subunit alpha [Pseudomonas rubra]MDD1016373.1 exodeoxyribonuclease V subunit alpha [Pseudomonas rubra]MDD1041670.1 exodeoxyribonuclease V subunit alpha [Pseudomonas rubra]MDD1157166.1 exodeoxyribonuclease V subunit alpha [Pseudomonas rubra]